MVNIGDEITVKVTDIDELGRINLSRKDALTPEEWADEEARFAANGQHEREVRSERGGGRPRGGEARRSSQRDGDRNRPRDGGGRSRSR